MQECRINGQNYKIATSWDEISFRKLCAIINHRNDSLKVLAILLGMPDVDLSKAKITGLEKIIPKLSFLSVEPETLIEIGKEPNRLGPYRFPKDVTFETIGQYQEVLQEINKLAQTNDLSLQTEGLAFYCAVYCQPLNEIGGEYDSGRARLLTKAFMDLPCLEVLAAGYFFQIKCMSIQSGLSMNFLKRNIQRKKNRLVFGSFLRRSGFMLLWIISLGTLGKPIRRF